MTPPKRIISDELITKERSSWLDSAGQVFEFDGLIYRGLNEEGIQAFSYISKKGIAEKLFKEGLILTSEADFRTETFSIVLKHKTIEKVSFPQEWTLAMFQRAALLTCNLTLDLLDSGLTLKDAHPWNLTFDQSRLVFIDFGSISFFEPSLARCWLQDFYTHFYVPLWIGAYLGSTLAHQSKKEHSPGFSKHLFSSRLIQKILFPYSRHKKYTIKEFRRIVEKIISKVSKLHVPNRQGEWSTYQSSSWKKYVIQDFINTVEINSCIDMACNKGDYSVAIAEKGIPVVAVDLDEYSINHLHGLAEMKDLPITSLVLDFLNPTSRFGMGLCYKNSFTRLKSDASLSLAIIHHLAFKSHINFEIFRNIISGYTKKYALVEFIPSTDPHVQPWLKDRKKDSYSWYTRENFLFTFSCHFDMIKSWKCPDSEREIFLFSKNKKE